MFVFTPNTLIESSKVNANFAEQETRLDVSETHTSQVLASAFTSAASATYQDTGLQITLATAGTWHIMCDLRLTNGSGTADYVTGELYNETTSTEYTESRRISNYNPGESDAVAVTCPLNYILTTTTVDNVIRVDIKPSAARAAILASDTNGYSAMFARRIV